MDVLDTAELKIHRGLNWSTLLTFWMFSCLRVKIPSSAVTCLHQICQDL